MPVNVPASAVTTISPLPSNATPFIFLAVVNFVAVLAVPAEVAVVTDNKTVNKVTLYGNVVSYRTGKIAREASAVTLIIDEGVESIIKKNSQYPREDIIKQIIREIYIKLVEDSESQAAPTATPAGTTRVNWLGATINTVSLARFATGFVTGKSELLPIPQPSRDANRNLTQNPGY